MRHSDGGKGSAPRPIPDWDKFSANFDAIFGGKNAGKSKNPESIEGQETSSDGGANSQSTDAK